MGIGVLVLGRSGSGKSCSLRAFAPEEVGVLNVMGKPLPFRSKLQCVDNCDYDRIEAVIASGKRRAWVIDDAGYLMSNENFRRACESGYTKYTEMAQKFQHLIRAIALAPSDCIVYVLMHPDYDEYGRERPKTTGKMIDQTFCLEGAFTFVLDCVVADGEHVFITTSDGRTVAKAPIGCLPERMPNDLKEVDRLIREYYEMPPLADKSKEE